ncbi:unnamed protein product [Darwinula stevensoni]|uniref:C2H2-type domain-containing protein n=1 Tax=Darwinula stevensoni TaxID=69355 RepID=A0A7R8X624_9CRUS|nr:unnamed protein product [Darwinula stevensoni]CAG0880811.1 unnamed protein product [Darwinula stevensoni]
MFVKLRRGDGDSKMALQTAVSDKEMKAWKRSLPSVILGPWEVDRHEWRTSFRWAPTVRVHDLDEEDDDEPADLGRRGNPGGCGASTERCYENELNAAATKRSFDVAFLARSDGESKRKKEEEEEKKKVEDGEEEKDSGPGPSYSAFTRVFRPSANANLPPKGATRTFVPSFLLCLSAQNTCAECKLSFRMTSDLVCHMRTQHKRTDGIAGPGIGTGREKLGCPICGEAFRERHHLTRHMSAHRNKREEEDEEEEREEEEKEDENRNSP